MRLFRNKNSAVTLLELMLVIAVIAILATVATFAIVNFNRRTQDQSAMHMLRLILAAADSYRSQYNIYPIGTFNVGSSDFGPLETLGYISNPNAGSSPPRAWDYTFSASATNSVTLTASGALPMTSGRQFTLTKTYGMVMLGGPPTVTSTGPNPWGNNWY